jgi:hypothetical protein
MKLSFLAFVSSLLISPSVSQECPLSWKCPFTDTAPTLDGDVAEWDSIEGIESTLQMPLTNTTYDAGPALTKCMYDDTNLYLALEIPGLYRFDTLDNNLCAAIATMMKIGVDATYFNMGGCPDAIADTTTCNATVLETCAPYLVDIGAHWELAPPNKVSSTLLLQPDKMEALTTSTLSVPIAARMMIAMTGLEGGRTPILPMERWEPTSLNSRAPSRPPPRQLTVK